MNDIIESIQSKNALFFSSLSKHLFQDAKVRVDKDESEVINLENFYLWNIWDYR